MDLNAYEIIALLAAFAGIAMVVGGILLIGKGAITLAALPKTTALSIEWKKQFKMSTQVPGLAFFVIGLLFVVIPLVLLKPKGIVPIEFQGQLTGIDEPVSISVRPANWELPGNSTGEISGKVYPDLSFLVIVINAPGYEPLSKSVKINTEGPHVANLGTIELRRKVEERNIKENVAPLPFSAPAPAKAPSYGGPL